MNRFWIIILRNKTEELRLRIHLLFEFSSIKSNKQKKMFLLKRKDIIYEIYEIIMNLDDLS